MTEQHERLYSAVTSDQDTALSDELSECLTPLALLNRMWVQRLPRTLLLPLGREAIRRLPSKASQSALRRARDSSETGLSQPACTPNEFFERDSMASRRKEGLECSSIQPETPRQNPDSIMLQCYISTFAKGLSFGGAFSSLKALSRTNAYHREAARVVNSWGFMNGITSGIMRGQNFNMQVYQGPQGTGIITLV